VDHHYFDTAFNIYRDRYNTDTMQVIFIAVSDDFQWIKDNLGHHDDVVFGCDDEEDSVAVIGYDLCLLSSCSHSVITYGTFGMWGALLAGGDVITTTGNTPGKYTEEDHINQRAAMDNWIFLNVRDKNNITEVTLLDIDPEYYQSINLYFL